MCVLLKYVLYICWIDVERMNKRKREHFKIGPYHNDRYDILLSLTILLKKINKINHQLMIGFFIRLCVCVSLLMAIKQDGLNTEAS